MDGVTQDEIEKLRIAWALADASYWGKTLYALPKTNLLLSDFEITKEFCSGDQYDVQGFIGYRNSNNTIYVVYRGT